MQPDPLLCESSDCGEAYAIFAMLWPGSSEALRVCLACGARAAAIAEAMGFKLDIRSIEGASIYGDQKVTPSLRQLLEVE